jgi:hypothetical protein
MPFPFRRRRTFYRGLGPLLPKGQTMSEAEYEQWRDENTWDPSRRTNLVIETDLAPAAWIEPLLSSGSFEVRMTAPQGFEAYARVFFPFVEWTRDGSGEPVEQFIRWKDLAEQNGWTAHVLMEQESISRNPNGEVDFRSPRSNLSSEQLEALLPILQRHTSSTNGWFLLWDGFGDLNERAFNDSIPKLHHPMREYYLLSGPLGSYAEIPHGPNYWWPDDHAWCVSTDTDFVWSYVAATSVCIEKLVAVRVMDAIETKPENPAHSGMDVINCDPD